MAVETGVNPGAVLGTASCVACGGPVPVSLLEPGPRCPFCGSARPLAPRLAGRLARLHALRSRRAAREEQLAGRQARLGTSFTVPMLLLGVLPLYALVAAGAWFTFPRPRGTGVLSLLVPQAPREGSEGTVTWWVLWAVATAFATTTLLWGAGLLGLRRLVAFAAPEPPARPGPPPRCRCCGSGLHDPGPILRCRSCGADSIAGPDSTRAAEASLEGALARFEKRLSATLAARSARAFRLLSAAATAPIALAVLSPLGLLVKRCPPALWLVTAALLAGGTALLVAAARVPVPVLRTLEGARPGDTVELHGVPWLVASAHRLGGTGSWSGLLVLLASGPGAPPGRLLHARSVPGKEELGLTELETVEAAAPGPGFHESYRLTAGNGNPPPWNVELVADLRLHEGRLAGLELRAGSPLPAGAPPLLSARSVREGTEADALFVAAP